MENEELGKEAKKLPTSFGMRQLNSIKYKVFDFKGEWFDIFGKPEIGATWFIWGSSASGKSTFCAQIAYLLSQYTKVLYLALEEKHGKSIRTKLAAAGFNNNSKAFQLLDKSDYRELIQRLYRRGSEEVIIIDSIQYMNINYNEYKSLIEAFPAKTFIFISHSIGVNPKGNTANAIHYDAGVKIWVEGGRIDVKHRFEGGGGQMVIIKELAEKYWNEAPYIPLGGDQGGKT